MKLDFDYVRRAGRNIRIHGNGFVQIDLLDKPGCRIHLFGHPGIPRQVSPTPIHDHRFGFISAVLKGCLVNVRWNATEISLPLATHVVCHYEASAPGSEDTKLEPRHEFVSVWKDDVEVLRKGDMYLMKPGRLHETFANEPTLTFMRKTQTIKSMVPRVLCRIGQEPDNSFDRHQMMKEAHIWEIVRDAFEGVSL